MGKLYRIFRPYRSAATHPRRQCGWSWNCCGCRDVFADWSGCGWTRERMRISANFACSETAAWPVPVAWTAGENFHSDCSTNDLFLVCRNCRWPSLRHHTTAICPSQSHRAGRIASLISWETSMLPCDHGVWWHGFKDVCFVIHRPPQIVSFSVNHRYVL